MTSLKSATFVTSLKVCKITVSLNKKSNYYYILKKLLLLLLLLLLLFFTYKKLFLLLKQIIMVNPTTHELKLIAGKRGIKSCKNMSRERVLSTPDESECNF